MVIYMVNDKKFTPLKFNELPVSKMLKASAEFKNKMLKRRTVRMFSEKKVDRKIIENCLIAAGSAPSGANMQPWRFVVVSDPQIKKRIREEAEKVETQFYKEKISKDWLNALMPLGTNAGKPFLEKAPYLIVIFEKRFDEDKDGKKIKYYFTKKSVGIAVGILITAIHHAGLVSLTYTPNPMNFLNKILNRPDNENPFLILVVGYPAENAGVPDITRKKLDEIAVFI